MNSMMVANRTLRVTSWLPVATAILILSSVYFMNTPAFASATGNGATSMLQYGSVSTGYNSVNSAQKITVCKPNWSRGTWSTCVNGMQTRSVTDSKNCNSTVGKPSTTRTCTMPVCTPKWSTGAWSACTNGNQTRTVTDSNNCENLTGKPATIRACKMPTRNNVTTCTPNWSTGTWSACVNGTQTRTVVDLNRCGTTTGQPSASQTCTVPVCTPHWIAGNWSTCTNGSQNRTVTDSNNCGNSTGQPATTQNCTMPIENNTTQNITPTPVPRNSLDTIDFAGYTWDVVNSNGQLTSPGPNYWNNSADSVYTDTAGRLHLEIRKVGTKWNVAEIDMQQSLGYGKYIFTTDSSVGEYDKDIVAAMFLYSFSSALNYPEVDIEYSRWSGLETSNGWLTVQDDSSTGGQSIFNISTVSDNHLINTIDWTSSRIIFQVNNSAGILKQWTYTGSYTPQTINGQLALINFWLFRGLAPSNGQNAELVVSNFTFIPDEAF